jgi:NAD(P)-dependent dehydrogenase (short-subunit alcohol dehydrogenase family)
LLAAHRDRLRISFLRLLQRINAATQLVQRVVQAYAREAYVNGSDSCRFTYADWQLFVIFRGGVMDSSPSSSKLGAAKIAIVTGAGSGIGKCVALALAQNGYSVVLAGRHKETLEKTALEARQCDSSQPDSRTLVVPADVGDPASVGELFAKTTAAFHRVDLLFNNAGISGPAVPLEDLTYEDWKSVVDANLTGAFLCTQAAFKIMKSQNPRGGRIINNGSISAHAPRPNSAPYTATKHAILGLTKATSLDGRKYDIACGQIDIGNAATEMAEKMKKGVPQANGTIAVEPTMDPAEVGRAVVYMASLPLDTNVQFMTIMATKMPYIGRG